MSDAPGSPSTPAGAAARRARMIDAEAVDAALTFEDLVAALREGFRRTIHAPLRHHHDIAQNGQSDATFLLMPAWDDLGAGGRGHIGLKAITLFPDNPKNGRATIMGLYLLMDGASGAPLAVIDAKALTLWRTAAASALAASYLAREDATRMVMVGAGALAPYLVRAHASVRPVRTVHIWNRDGDKAKTVAADLAKQGFEAQAVDELEGPVRACDIVSCATMSDKPLVRGQWLKPGTHVDLVGAFTPDMRETDDDAVRRSRIFADTRDGVLAEAGDIIQPIRAEIISQDDIVADLFDLARGHATGREDEDDITLFKSVGTALEDLVGARLIYEKATQGQS